MPGSRLAGRAATVRARARAVSRVPVPPWTRPGAVRSQESLPAAAPRPVRPPERRRERRRWLRARIATAASSAIPATFWVAAVSYSDPCVRERCSMLSSQWLRNIGGAFAFWIVFMLALEPGNVLHASSMGHALDFGDEALRICGAALLGCSTAPLIVELRRRFPIFGARGWRSIAIHSA